MYSYGSKSQSVKETLCEELALVADDVIQVYNISLIEGHRTKEKQDHYFETGASKLKFPNSKHNTYPSDALDAWPYVEVLAGVPVHTALSGHPDQIAELSKKTGYTKERIWQLILQEYATMKGVFMAMAYKRGIKLRFGDDWDGDHDRLDQSFIDLPHMEVVRNG